MAEKYRASQSFTDGEVALLDYICQMLLKSQAPDVSLVHRHPSFQKLSMKVVRMRQRVKAAKPSNVPPRDQNSSTSSEGSDQTG